MHHSPGAMGVAFPGVGEVGSDERRRVRRRRSRLIRIAFDAAAVGAVVFFAWRERHVFGGFTSTLSRVTWYWVLLAFVAEMASIPPLAEAQRVVLRAGGANVSRRPMNLVTLASNAVSMSVPAGVALAEGYTYRQYRRMGASTAVAGWAELASGALAFAALAAVALTGSLIGGGAAEGILLPVLSVVVAGSCSAAALFRHPHVLIAAIDWIDRNVSRHLGSLLARATTRVRAASHQLSHVHPPVSTWMTAFGLSAANWLLDVASFALAFQAIGGPVPWGALLLAFAGSKVVSSVGILPGGLGIVEGGLVAVLVAYGTAGPTAVGAVVLYRALTLVGLVGLGWLAAGILAIGARPRSHPPMAPTHARAS
jgi:putative heme transporter